MEKKILLLFSFFIFAVCNSQQLKNVLADYTISKIPTNRSIVGAKWVSDLGATMEGLNEDKLVISQSLNQLSLDKENQGSLSVALLSVLGLSGYATDDLKVIFNKLEIYTIKNLYELPLSKGEKVVFSSVKVASFDLEYTKKLSANILMKLNTSNLSGNGEIDLGSKKRITLNGSNLFVAHKIIMIDDIETKTKSKRLRNDFSVKDILDYEISFNITKLVSSARKRTIEEIGVDRYNTLQGIDQYIQKYSKETPIEVNIMSTSRGNLVAGVFNSTINICYCELIGGQKKLYPINIINSGNKITFDYLYIDKFWIKYRLMQGIRSAETNESIGMLSIEDNGKISLISKTYYLSKVTE